MNANCITSLNATLKDVIEFRSNDEDENGIPIGAIAAGGVGAAGIGAAGYYGHNRIMDRVGGLRSTESGFIGKSRTGQYLGAAGSLAQDIPGVGFVKEHAQRGSRYADQLIGEAKQAWARRKGMKIGENLKAIGKGIKSIRWSAGQIQNLVQLNAALKDVIEFRAYEEDGGVGLGTVATGAGVAGAGVGAYYGDKAVMGRFGNGVLETNKAGIGGFRQATRAEGYGNALKAGKKAVTGGLESADKYVRGIGRALIARH